MKDVNFMKRDELVQWYRDMHTYKKRVAYLKVKITFSIKVFICLSFWLQGVNRPVELAALKQRKPRLNMDHFVRER